MLILKCYNITYISHNNYSSTFKNYLEISVKFYAFIFLKIYIKNQRNRFNMLRKYHLSTIIHGLLVAPIPILLGLFIYAVFTEPSLSNNYENNSYFRFLTTMTIGAYLLYLFFICPILFCSLYLMNKFNFINFFTLFLTSYLYTLLLSVLGDYLKNSDLPNTASELKALFIVNPFLIITLSTAFTFWCYIKVFGNKYEKN